MRGFKAWQLFSANRQVQDSRRSKNRQEYGSPVFPEVREPPFLFWPVTRGAFYRAINWAMVLPLVWGIVVFGQAAMEIIATMLVGMAVSYFPLRRWTVRGKLMEFNHALACTLITVALASPTMPLWFMLGVAVMIPVLIWVCGLPGREQVHVALLVPLFFLVVFPQPPRWPLLARDRIIFGNIHLTAPVRHYDWPTARELHGEDATKLVRPADAISLLYKRIAPELGSHKAQQAIHQTFAFDLPSPQNLLLGAVSGWIGTGSIVAIILAGLYLSWRHVLAPQAWGAFLGSVTLGLIFGPLAPHAFHHDFWQSLGGIWFLKPEQAVSLLAYELLSSDFIFASVFILALPGTMPMEPLPRQIFLLLAGLGAALAHRLLIPIPPATFAILLLQPLAPAFDALFHRRSWLLWGLRLQK